MMPSYFDIYHVPPQRIWGLGNNLVTVAIFIPTNGDLVVVLAPKIPQWFRDDQG